MRSQYDHNEKAGNQGDICKHPALIAALDETITRSAQTSIRYADIYAGYALNPLLEGKEWRFGISRVWGQHLLSGNKHVALWGELAGLNDAPHVGGVYPGSAWFASKVCARRRIECELSLWETSAEPLKNLKRHFSGGHHIFNRATTPNEPAVKNADFVFIDPPDKGHWPRIRDLVRTLDERRQSVLIWLPVGVNTISDIKPLREDRLSGVYRHEARQDLNLRVTKVRWQAGGRTIGCQLLYRFLKDEAGAALRRAVQEIVHHAKWESPVEHWPS